MQGFVHFDSVERDGKEAVQVTCHVKCSSVFDKLHMLELLCSTLEVTKSEWMLYVHLKDLGVFDRMVAKESIRIEIPTKEGN